MFSWNLARIGQAYTYQTSQSMGRVGIMSLWSRLQWKRFRLPTASIYCSTNAHLFFHKHILLAYGRAHTPPHVPPSHSHAHMIQCYCRYRLLFLLSLGWKFSQKIVTSNRLNQQNDWLGDNLRRLWRMRTGPMKLIKLGLGMQGIVGQGD